jgi:hypothetical protein
MPATRLQQSFVIFFPFNVGKTRNDAKTKKGKKDYEKSISEKKGWFFEGKAGGRRILDFRMCKLHEDSF